MLSIVPERLRKSVPVQSHESFELTVGKATTKSTHGSCSIDGVLHQMQLPFSTVQKVIR